LPRFLAAAPAVEYKGTVRDSMQHNEYTEINTTETLLTHTLFQRTFRWSPTDVSLVYDERSVQGRRTLRSRVRERTICTYSRKCYLCN